MPEDALQIFCCFPISLLLAGMGGLYMTCFYYCGWPPVVHSCVLVMMANNSVQPMFCYFYLFGTEPVNSRGQQLWWPNERLTQPSPPAASMRMHFFSPPLGIILVRPLTSNEVVFFPLTTGRGWTRTWTAWVYFSKLLNGRSPCSTYMYMVF